MEAPTSAALACFAEVLEHLTGRLGDDEVAIDEDQATATLTLGSARAHVAAVPHGEDSAVVVVWATVVTGVRPTPELVHHVLRLNANRLFAGFHLHGDALNAQHAFIGRPLNPGQLFASVGEVLAAADEHDTDLAHRFAGLTAADREGGSGGHVVAPEEPALPFDELVERLGWLQRRQTAKARRKLEELLRTGEPVHDLAAGDAGGNGLVAVTDRRLIYVPNWKRDEPAERDFPYGDLTTVTWAEAGDASTLAARAGQRAITVRMAAKDAERIAAFLAARLA